MFSELQAEMLRTEGLSHLQRMRILRGILIVVDLINYQNTDLLACL